MTNDEDDDEEDGDVGLLHASGDDHTCGRRRVQDSKAVTQPVTAPTSAGERPRAQNRPNPLISSAYDRPRAIDSYLISVRSVVRVYPGPLDQVEPP